MIYHESLFERRFIDPMHPTLLAKPAGGASVELEQRRHESFQPQKLSGTAHLIEFASGSRVGWFLGLIVFEYPISWRLIAYEGHKGAKRVFCGSV